jgi:hypothetical protein
MKPLENSLNVVAMGAQIAMAAHFVRFAKIEEYGHGS